MIYGGGFNFLNVSLNDNEHPVFFLIHRVDICLHKSRMTKH